MKNVYPTGNRWFVVLLFVMTLMSCKSKQSTEATKDNANTELSDDKTSSNVTSEKNSIWLMKPQGIQCQPQQYESKEQASNELSSIGIMVLETYQTSLMVCQACGCPTSNTYVFKVKLPEGKDENEQTLQILKDNKWVLIESQTVQEFELR